MHAGETHDNALPAHSLFCGAAAVFFSLLFFKLRSGFNVFQRGILRGASGHGRSLPLFLRRPAPHVQAGALHRTRLRAANGSPPSASTSLTKGGGPSTPAAEWAGKAKRLAAYARLAPAAKKEDQRRAKAADTAPRTRGGTLLARARASRCTKSTVSGLKRPPTSSARTTSLQRESGRRELRVCALLGPPGLAQGCALGSVLVAPRGTCRGQGRHQRTASCMPPHRGKPLAMTSIRRSSPGTLPTLRSLTNVCIATTAPASRQMRAAARSSGPPRARKTPDRGHAER